MRIQFLSWEDMILRSSELKASLKNVLNRIELGKEFRTELDLYSEPNQVEGLRIRYSGFSGSDSYLSFVFPACLLHEFFPGTFNFGLGVATCYSYWDITKEFGALETLDRSPLYFDKRTTIQVGLGSDSRNSEPMARLIDSTLKNFDRFQDIVRQINRGGFTPNYRKISGLVI